MPTRQPAWRLGMMPQQRGTRTARWGAIALTAGALAVAGCSASSAKNTASSGGSKPASPSATASGGGGSLTAAEAVKQAAAQAQKATSYAADVTVQTTGTAASQISDTMH